MTDKTAQSSKHTLEKIKGEVEHVFERLAENWHEFESSISEHLPEWLPKVGKPKTDASELDNVIEFSMEVPGLDSNDIDVMLENGVLVIKGEKESESEQHKKNYYLKERSVQKYYRSFSLPSDVETDNILANCRNGLLTIKIPKKISERPPAQKIKIES